MFFSSGDAQQRVRLDFLADHTIVKNYICVSWSAGCSYMGLIKEVLLHSGMQDIGNILLHLTIHI